MKLDRKALIKRCDRLRQTIARYSGAKKKGGVWYNTCVTCGKTVRCDKANGGHFIPRACYPLRWDRLNVNCQCVACNLYKNGAYIEYSKWFLDKYGKVKFDTYVERYQDWRAGKTSAIKMAELKVIYDELLTEGRLLEKKLKLDLFPKTWVSFGPDFIEQPLKK